MEIILPETRLYMHIKGQGSIPTVIQVGNCCAVWQVSELDYSGAPLMGGLATTTKCLQRDSRVN